MKIKEHDGQIRKKKIIVFNAESGDNIDLRLIFVYQQKMKDGTVAILLRPKLTR